MRIEAMLLTGLLALSGCQSTAFIEPNFKIETLPPPCVGGSTGSNNANCRIQLKVVENGSACSVEFVDPTQAEVIFQAGRQNLWVVLELTNASAGYRFPKKDAVAVSLDPFHNFTAGRAIGPKDEGYALLNVNSRAWGVGNYEYKVYVNHPTPGRTCVLDPWYRNR
jgi:hypothetical protein